MFGLPRIIPGTGKATNFKFCRYIHRVHPNKRPLKILGKKCGRIQGLPKFLPLSFNRVVVTINNTECIVVLFQVLNGLMERSDWLSAIKTPIGVLPAGSGNALASALAHRSG